MAESKKPCNKETFHAAPHINQPPTVCSASADTDYCGPGLMWIPFNHECNLTCVPCIVLWQVTTLCTLVCMFPRATTGGDATDASLATRRSGSEPNWTQKDTSLMGRTQMTPVQTSWNLSVSFDETNCSLKAGCVQNTQLMGRSLVMDKHLFSWLSPLGEIQQGPANHSYRISVPL